MDDTTTPTEATPKITSIVFPDAPGWELRGPDGSTMIQVIDALLVMLSVTSHRGWNEADGYKAMSDDLVRERDALARRNEQEADASHD